MDNQEDELRLAVVNVLAGSTLILLIGDAFADSLIRGRAFPLSSGVTPILLGVEVHRVQSDGLIDVAVSLGEPHAVGPTREEMLELGEFCLRYGEEILREVVPAAEHGRLRVFVPLYRSARADSAGKLTEQGFGFMVSDGRCTLSTPFPDDLKAEAGTRAAAKVP